MGRGSGSDTNAVKLPRRRKAPRVAAPHPLVRNPTDTLRSTDFPIRDSRRRPQR